MYVGILDFWNGFKYVLHNVVNRVNHLTFISIGDHNDLWLLVTVVYFIQSLTCVFEQGLLPCWETMVPTHLMRIYKTNGVLWSLSSPRDCVHILSIILFNISLWRCYMTYCWPFGIAITAWDAWSVKVYWSFSESQMRLCEVPSHLMIMSWFGWANIVLGLMLSILPTWISNLKGCLHIITWSWLTIIYTLK